MKKLMILGAALAVLAGCSSEEELVNNYDGKVPVNFSGDVASITKAPSSLTGKDVQIWAYTKDATITTATPIETGKYTSADGSLTGKGSYIMYLKKGDYDFYAVSPDNLTFTNGAAEVTNGTDYLWSKTAAAAIPAANAIGFTFDHKAAQLKINVAAGDGVQLVSVTSVTATLPDKSSLDLATGVITLATAVTATQTPLTVTDKSALYSVLPIQENVELTIKITAQVKIGSSTTAEAKNYTAKITTPTGGFVAGKQYEYTATLKASSASFGGATENEWSNIPNVNIPDNNVTED